MKVEYFRNALEYESYSCDISQLLNRTICKKEERRLKRSSSTILWSRFSKWHSFQAAKAKIFDDLITLNCKTKERLPRLNFLIFSWLWVIQTKLLELLFC